MRAGLHARLVRTFLSSTIVDEVALVVGEERLLRDDRRDAGVAGFARTRTIAPGTRSPPAFRSAGSASSFQSFLHHVARTKSRTHFSGYVAVREPERGVIDGGLEVRNALIWSRKSLAGSANETRRGRSGRSSSERRSTGHVVSFREERLPDRPEIGAAIFVVNQGRLRDLDRGPGLLDQGLP
jgi:hypothetical protein